MSSSTAAFFFSSPELKIQRKNGIKSTQKKRVPFLTSVCHILTDACGRSSGWTTLAWESTQFHIWPAVTAIIPLFRLRISGDGGPPVCYLSLITQGLQELTRSSVDPRIGVYVLKKKTISVTCISSGTELTALFTVRCSELGSSAGKEVPVSFRDVLCLGYSAVRDGLTVGLQLTALLFDAHQYFSFVS